MYLSVEVVKITGCYACGNAPGAFSLADILNLAYRSNITGWLLGAFAKLQKAIISFVMTDCHSVRPLVSHNTAPAVKDFRGILHCQVLLTSVEKIQFWLKSDTLHAALHSFTAIWLLKLSLFLLPILPTLI